MVVFVDYGDEVSWRDLGRKAQSEQDKKTGVTVEIATAT